MIKVKNQHSCLLAILRTAVDNFAPAFPSKINWKDISNTTMLTSTSLRLQFSNRYVDICQLLGMISLWCLFKNVFDYRPPQNHHLNQDSSTKKVLFFTSFFNTGWQFFGLHPEKLAKVNEREINTIKDECNTMRVG